MTFVVRKLEGFLDARAVWWLLAAAALLLGMTTRQWLFRNTLINPPSYDALVYHNQSYDDLLLLETGGWKKYLQKYTSGIWHVPPLYMMLGTATHLLFGLSPANAYAINAVFFFIFSWSCYLLFRYVRAGRVASLFGTLIVALTPSTVSYALRHYMTDYAAAALYLYATALLLQTRQLRSRGKVLACAISLGFSLLIKSSLVLYYVPHLAIIAFWLFAANRNRSPRWMNFLRMAGVTLLMVGWFYIANLGQILTYYLGWAGSRSVITTSVAGIATKTDSWLYYFRNIARFHYEGVGGRWIWGLLAGILALAVVSRLWSRVGWGSPRGVYLVVVLVGQYLVLTAYPSKVFVVDYSLVPFYFLLPLAYFFDQRRRAPHLYRILALLILMLGSLTLSRSANLLLQAAPAEERQHWKVRDTLGEILKDAEKVGYDEVLVGSTPIHPYFTCENMRFYTLSGSFPGWRNGFKMPRIGYAKDAEELYSFVKTCDYVVTVDGWQGPDQAPNNHLAPQVNDWLAHGRGGFELFLDVPIPHNSRAKVYKRGEHLTLGPIEGDGWVLKGFSVVLHSRQTRVKIRLEGKMPLPAGLSYPAQLYLTGPQQEQLSNFAVVADSRPFSTVFEVAMRPEWQGIVRMELVGDRSYSPRARGISDDARQLLVILNRIVIEE